MDLNGSNIHGVQKLEMKKKCRSAGMFLNDFIEMFSKPCMHVLSQKATLSQTLVSQCQFLKQIKCILHIFKCRRSFIPSGVVAVVFRGVCTLCYNPHLTSHKETKKGEKKIRNVCQKKCFP